MSAQYKNTLLALGYEDTEARILGLLISGRMMTASEIEKESNLSRGTVYQVLGKFVKEGKLHRTSDRPARYHVADHFLDLIKENISEILETVVPRLIRARRRSQSQIVKETLDVFQALGYAIEEASFRHHEPTMSYFYDETGTVFDYIAEGEYRFAISFVDETRERMIRTLIDADSIYPIVFSSQRLGCISSFFIVNPDFELADRFIKFIESNSDEIPITIFPQLSEEGEISQFIGIEKKGPFVVETSKNVRDFITERLLNIRNQRILINESLKKIQNTMKDIERITIDSEVSARNLIEFRRLYLPYIYARSRRLPRREFREIRKFVQKIRQPVGEIARREKRNLDLMQIDYRRFFVEFNSHLESIERRFYLPSLETINGFTSRVEELKLNFDSIFFELRSLEREFRSPFHIKRMRFLNPFIFTVPFEPEGPFIVDQEKAETEIKRVADNIEHGITNAFRFITAEPGLGKTHILENLAIPAFNNKKILCVRVNCPLKMDLLDCFYPSLLRNLPEDILDEIKELDAIKDESVLRTMKHFIGLVDELVESALANGLKGVVFLVDEFENPFHSLLLRQKRRVSIDPLPIRQLREIITSEIPHLGFLFFSRKRACDFMKTTLDLSNFDQFTLNVERLHPNQMKKIIEHRYSLWDKKSQRPTFSSTIVKEIFKLTNGNIRNSLKYFRELYRYAEIKRNKTITIRTLKAIGSLPVFVDLSAHKL